MNARRESENARAVREYLHYQRHTRGRSDHTLRLYTGVCEALLDWLDTTPLARASTENLQRFVDRGERAANTRARDASIVRSLYAYMHGRGWLVRNPSLLVASPKQRTHHPKAIDDSVWLQVWNLDLEPADRILLGLGMFLGLRREEMCRLEPRHVNTERGLLQRFVRKGGGDDTMPYRDLIELWRAKLPQLGVSQFELEPYAWKRAGSAYLLPFGEEVNPLYRDARNTYMPVPAHMTHPNTVNDRLRRLDAPFTPHALRHSFVTNLLRADLPLDMVTELANHSGPQVTWRYVKTGGGRLRAWMGRTM